MGKTKWKSVRPRSLDEAMEFCTQYAAERRRPLKVIADLMGVELKTLYRWLAETSMPLNRVRQFEEFCGAAFVSEYLCLAHGDKVVVSIPAGRKAEVTDLADVQASFSQAMVLLSHFYKGHEGLDETVAAINASLTQLAYQRANVQKVSAPELDFFGEAQ